MVADPDLDAIILAAGVGRRLGAQARGPKCLIEVGGKTLLERQLRDLRHIGARRITLCVGFQHERIADHLAARGWDDVEMVENDAYTEGSMVSLWTVRAALRSGRDVLLMDADVLSDPRMLERLAAGPSRNAMLLDRDFEAGEEPVKICLERGRIVEFRKRVPEELRYDDCGESVGFFRFEPAMADRLAARTETYVEAGDREAPHEEAIRDLARASPEAFVVEDATGIPWIEIDFPEDLVRARDEILPRLGAGA